MERETIKIEPKKGKKGFRIINVVDFDPRVHTIFGEKPAEEKAPKSKPATKKKDDKKVDADADAKAKAKALEELKKKSEKVEK